MKIKKLLEKLKPIDFHNFPFIKGTYQRFGLKATLTMLSPLLNYILYFKYRNYYLIIPELKDINISDKKDKDNEN